MKNSRALPRASLSLYQDLLREQSTRNDTEWRSCARDFPRGSLLNSLRLLLLCLGPGPKIREAGSLEKKETWSGGEEGLEPASLSHACQASNLEDSGALPHRAKCTPGLGADKAEKSHLTSFLESLSKNMKLTELLNLFLQHVIYLPCKGLTIIY